MGDLTIATAALHCLYMYITFSLGLHHTHTGVAGVFWRQRYRTDVSAEGRGCGNNFTEDFNFPSIFRWNDPLLFLWEGTASVGVDMWDNTTVPDYG